MQRLRGSEDEDRSIRTQGGDSDPEALRKKRVSFWPTLRRLIHELLSGERPEWIDVKFWPILLHYWPQILLELWPLWVAIVVTCLILKVEWWVLAGALVGGMIVAPSIRVKQTIKAIDQAIEEGNNLGGNIR